MNKEEKKYNKIIVMPNTFKALRQRFVWPSKEFEDDPGRIFYLKFCCFALTACSLQCSIAFHLFHGGDTTFMDYDIAVILASVGCYYFNFVFITQIRYLAPVYRELSSFSDFGKPHNFDEVHDRLNRFSYCHHAYITACGTLIGLSPHHAKINKIFLETIFEILVGRNFPELFELPLKVFSCLMTIYSISAILCTSSVISFTMAESLEHLVIRLKHLKYLFLKAFDNHKETHKQSFDKCVEYHIRILRLAEILDKSFNASLFIHIVLTGVILAAVGHSVIQKRDVMCSSLLLFAWFWSLVMAGFSGQRLIDESLSVANALYESNWINTKLEIQKGCVLVLLRCRKPLCIHGGPFGVMAYGVILKILQTTYTFLTMLTNYH